MNNKLIEELNYKIDNQENIIRELQEKITLLNKMNEDNYNKYCNELKKNSKAIEYIKENGCYDEKINLFNDNICYFELSELLEIIEKGSEE